ncbi:hypothetical protein [Aquimarina sp. RZ0]|uniref:hypothetical protein n=1 Tax=Aquimarina sp. RZ0 TaxID=2607730 RepID=UPI0011F0F96C|nr:hypothetical protein [Aquimarina sp. RZ0]KAA1242411.1 hypothetical protein F0000_25750 [Aquimarina sp. RZ0]
MKVRIIFLFFQIVFLISCKGQTRNINLTQKIFEQVGYAKDQLSPEQIKNNQEFANTFVTTRAKIEFLNDTLVNISYWNYDQGELSNECKYTVKGSTIICENFKNVGFLGRKFEIQNDSTIIGVNGQIKGEYKLINDTNGD